MNKIVGKNQITISSGLYSIKYSDNKASLIIDGNVTIKDFNNKDISLNIELKDNSHLIYLKKNTNSKNDYINIILNNTSSVLFNYSLKTKVCSKIIFNSKVIGNNNVSKINFHGVSDGRGKIDATATSDVAINTLDNEVLENLRIIALNDTENTIIPNLLVSTDNVRAIHNTTISGVPKDYLFYLNSKGIDEKRATKLIVDGFLKNNIKL